MTDTRRSAVQTSGAALGRAGAAHYFHPSVLAKGKEAGLDGFRLYFLGRGGVLGNVEWPVVLAAFGYFNPATVDKIWTSACQIMEPRECSRQYLGWSHELGDELYADIPDDVLAGFNAAAAKVVATVDPSGLPLYAGFSAEPVPDGLRAAAIHNAIVLRELRGSVHLAAIVAAGLDPKIAHAIRRPDDAAMFGYDEHPPVNDADRELLAAIDVTTDDRMCEHLAVLGDEELAAFAAAAEALLAAVE